MRPLTVIWSPHTKQRSDLRTYVRDMSSTQLEEAPPRRKALRNNGVRPLSRQIHAPDNVSLTHPIGPVSYVGHSPWRAPDNDGLGAAVVRAAGVEVAKELGAPLLQGPAEAGELGDRA